MAYTSPFFNQSGQTQQLYAGPVPTGANTQTYRTTGVTTAKPAYTAPTTTTVKQSGTSSTVSQPQSQTGSSPSDLINQSVKDAGSSIERDYQDALMQADTAESGLRSQAAQATTELQNQGTQTANALEQQRQTAGTGISTQEQTAQKQAQSGMQAARDLFRQTQQSNIAQLSALGLSSSSVMEGLAEKLGVETARRIGGITGSRDEILQNLSKERARVDDYAKTKKLELEQNIQTQIQSIQNQLLQGIRQISDSRQMAATAKANARASLLSQAQAQIATLAQNQQQFEQQLTQWQLQKSTALSDASKAFTVTPADFSALNQANQNIQSITGVGGQLGGYVPSYTISPSGQFTTTVTKPKEDEAITQLKTSLGI